MPPDDDTIETMLNFLTTPLEDAVDTFALEAPYPTSKEIVLRPVPEVDTGIHIREDGVIQIFAGSAGILLDPATGTITFIGNHVLHQTSDVQFATDAGGVSLSGHPINPFWISSALSLLGFEIQSSTNTARISPLSQKYAGALDAVRVLIYDDVKDGDATVPLSDFLEANALFLPLRESGDILQGLGTLFGNTI